MASRGLARWVADLGADVRYGWRGLLRSPAFLAVAILSLALGIGANTAIFSLIDAVMLRTLPVRDPQQLVELLSHYPGDPRMNVFGWKHYLAFRERSDVFSAFVATAPSRSPFQVSRDGSPAEAVYGEFVVGDFFAALGMTPAAGRLIAVEDDRPDRSAVAVISWPYWKSRFNLDPAIVGRTLAVNGAPLTVVGVAPRRFEGLQTGFRTDIWMPIAEAAAMLPGQPQAREPLVAVIGRLKDGVSLDQAR
ncbi:MAG TPA: ABC transporter permease, partial [Vicinamibacterales bacterium]|nr:ABC transporter permease [Vicinamibacterales bacterium]